MLPNEFPVQGHKEDADGAFNGSLETLHIKEICSYNLNTLAVS